MKPEEWCAAVVGVPVESRVFDAGHLSRVTGLRLVDGREVVVKVRPWQDRLLACTTVQRVVSARGYPCPAPLAGPEQIDGLAWSLETARSGGSQLDVGTPGAAAAFAALLARLVELAEGHAPPLSVLRPAPPWVGWDTLLESGIWPPRDDTGPPVESFDGPIWLDEAGSRARALLRGLDRPPVIGHGDFESQNIRWHGMRPHAVHDWDSVVLQPEAAIAGAASAVWAAAGGSGQASTVEQSREFLVAYQAARGVSWSLTDRQAAWAAGLWIRAFNAKKDAADGGGQHLDRLAAELPQRLAEAGLD